MNNEIKEYIDKYPTEIINLFIKIRELIINSVSYSVDEKMWAKLPSYYIGESFIRLIPFKDHINIEASKIINYKTELTGFKITPKGMLQIYVNQEVPSEVLKKVFLDTLVN